MDINKKIDQINHKLNLKKFDEVILDCEKLIKVHSSTSIFHNFLGLALQAKGKHKESFKCFTKAIELDQKDYAPKINLANSFMYLNDFENAEKIFNKLMIEKPTDFLLIANFANFKKKIKDFKSAVELYEDAFKKSNYQPFIMNDLAKIYLNIGQFEKSKKIYEEIIKKFPLSVDAHISLSRLINYSADQKHMKTMIDIYKNSNLEDHEKGILAFGISKAFEDLSDFKMSYTYFKDANQLIDRNLKYNLSNEQKLFSSIKKNFERFKTSEIKEQNENKRIIFVCGLPRSGTTLVEQILSSHKEAIGIGEVEYLETAIQKFFIQDNKVLSLQNPIREGYFNLRYGDDDDGNWVGNSGGQQLNNTPDLDPEYINSYSGWTDSTQCNHSGYNTSQACGRGVTVSFWYYIPEQWTTNNGSTINHQIQMDYSDANATRWDFFRVPHTGHSMSYINHFALGHWNYHQAYYQYVQHKHLKYQ